MEKKNDPKKWAVETNAYYVYDAKTIDFIAREIFNAKVDDIKKQAAQCEEDKILYLHKQKYYVLHEDGEYDLYDAVITDVNQEGGGYTVKFDVFLVNDTESESESNSQLMYTCTAKMALKTVDDSQLWSVFSFISEKK